QPAGPGLLVGNREGRAPPEDVPRGSVPHGDRAVFLAGGNRLALGGEGDVFDPRGGTEAEGAQPGHGLARERVPLRVRRRTIRRHIWPGVRASQRDAGPGDTHKHSGLEVAHRTPLHIALDLTQEDLFETGPVDRTILRLVVVGSEMISLSTLKSHG